MSTAIDTAARVRAARAWKGMDQTRLAEELDISVATLRRIESAQRSVSRAELERIAKVTGTPVEFLYDGFAANPPKDGKNSADEYRDTLTELARLEIENETLRAELGVGSADERVALLLEENRRLKAALAALASSPPGDTGLTGFAEAMSYLRDPSRQERPAPRRARRGVED
jgi:transcriptional regulator with XRE-family HTH domain